jgi:cellulose synthase (UDP-forming)
VSPATSSTDASRTAPLRLQRPASDGLPAPEAALRRLGVQALAVLTIGLSLGYLVWRVGWTLEGTTLWLSVPLVLLEAHALIGLLLFTHDLWNVDVRPDPADVPADERVDVDALRVAVLVPTYDEPREVLLPTVAAAVSTRHPHDTWVLDDGDRPWVRELAGELGARYRSRSGGAHAKAGNINEALPDVDADVVAVVDADHVVSERFLERLLPYFADPRVAVVQSPQEFYNDTSFEHVPTSGGGRYAEQQLFYRGLLAGRNRWGAAFWCGTGAAVRVEALRSVGGVATDSVTEDIQTSLRMHRRGWRTVHHNEVLAYGLAADTPRSFFIQRNRWGAGAMQVMHRDNPLLGRGLTVHQRLSYLSTLLGWFDSWRTIGYVLLPALTVLSGGLPVAAQWQVFLAVFVVTFAVQRLALRALARGHAPLLHSTLFDFVRLPATFAATLHLFGHGPSRFVVTPKAPTGERARSAPPTLLAALMALTVVAGAWYVATSLGLTPVTYAIPWVAHGAALWLVVNGLFVVLATRRIRQLRFAGNRRSAWRFESTVEVDLVLDGEAGGTWKARMLDVSTGGARLVVDGELGTRLALEPGARLTVLLPVDGAAEPLTVDGFVRGSAAGDDGSWTIGVGFQLTTAAAAALALALYRTPDPDIPHADQAPSTRPGPDGASVPAPRPGTDEVGVTTPTSRAALQG